jgi:hypothetical protein
LSAAPLKRSAIDVFFNFGGGHCWTRWQHPTWGPPSMSSSTSVVATPGHAGSTLQRARHRRLQLWWWPLSNPPAAPRKGPAIDVFFNFVGGRCQTRQQHPQGAHHRRLLQLRWWSQSDPPAAPPRGPPSMSSSSSVVAAVGPVVNFPMGLGINVFFNFGGGRCRIRRQHLSRGPPSTSSPTSVIAAVGSTGSTPKGPAIDVFSNFGGGRCRTCRQHPPRGPAIDVFYNFDGD